MLQPYKYQRTAITRIVEADTILGDDCGLGKTLVAIESYKELRRLRHKGPAIYVTIKTAVPQTVAYIKSQDPGVMVYRLSSDPDVPLPPIGKDDIVWCILHYEQLRKKHIYQFATKMFWGCAAIDEAHKIRNASTQRARQTKRIIAWRKLLMTATPMERHPGDLWSLLNYLNSHQFSSYWSFAEQFVEFEENWMGHRKAVGAKNPKGLARIIAPYYLARTKQEVAPELPPLTETIIPLEMDPKQARLYTAFKEEASRDILVDLDELNEEMLVVNQISLITRCLQISSCPWVLSYVSGGGSKLQWIVEDFEANQETPTFIFTRFRETAIAIADKLQIPLVIGQQEVPEIETWGVGTIAKAGTGLDLPHIDRAVFVDCDWSSTQMTQALQRIHRINITKPKQIVYLINQGTFDASVYEAFKSKADMADLIRRFVEHIRKGDV